MFFTQFEDSYPDIVGKRAGRSHMQEVAANFRYRIITTPLKTNRELTTPRFNDHWTHNIEKTAESIYSSEHSTINFHAENCVSLGCN